MTTIRRGIILFLAICTLFPLKTRAQDFSGFVFPDSNAGSSILPISLFLGESWYSSGGKGYIGHLGEDYVGVAGTPIYAVADGEVTFVSGWPECPRSKNHGWGPVVIIRHSIQDPYFFNSENTSINQDVEGNPSVVYAQYAHLKNLSVVSGEKVKKGQKIGEIGSVCPYIPHLHFEIKDSYAVENDVLGGIGTGYSGVDNHAPHRYHPTRFIEQNKNVISADDGAEIVRTGAVSDTKNQESSFFEKVRSFFAELFSKPNNSVIEEQEQASEQSVSQETHQPEPEKESIYALEFTPKEQAIKVPLGTKELRISVAAKNTGTETWERNVTSVNVVGGIEKNSRYRHASWVTNLRPAFLSEKTVDPGNIGTFSFLIRLPEIPGVYQFPIQIVRQDGARFLQIGEDFFVTAISVEDTEELLVTAEGTKHDENDHLAENTQTSDEHVLPAAEQENKKPFIESIKDTVLDTVKNISKTIGSIFSPSSGSNATSDLDPEIIVHTPTSSQWITNKRSFRFSGTANESASKVIIGHNNVELSEGTVIFEDGANWSADIELSVGENVVTFVAENEAGNRSSATAIDIMVDVEPPTRPVISMNSSEESSSSSVFGLTVEWLSEDEESGVESYDVWYKHAHEEEWVLLDNATSSLSTVITVEHLEEYDVKVRSRDRAGNVSDWGVFERYVVDWPKSVVINEVAWMGTSPLSTASFDCREHEWLELYNNSDVSIDVSGWTIEVIDENGAERKIALSPEATISAHGYYVISGTSQERQAFTHSVIGENFNGSEFDTGELFLDFGARIHLKDEEGNTIDEVNMQNGWTAGSAVNGPSGNFYRPMERISSSVPGSAVDNWQTNAHVSPYVESHACGQIFGTPGTSNHGPRLLRQPTLYYADGFNDENVLVLSKREDPYVLDSETTIPQGYTLQIDSGVVLVGINPSSHLTVQGELRVLGTDDEPVVFTSARDPELDSLSLSSFTSGTPVAGDWSGIRIVDGGNAVINGALFRYGGSPFTQGSGWVYGTKSRSHVVYSSGGSVDIRESKFENNYVVNADPEFTSLIAIDVRHYASTTLTVEDSVLDGGWRSINIQDEQEQPVRATVTGNTFQNFNDPQGVLFSYASIPQFVSNTLEQNVLNGISLREMSVTEETYLEPNMTYVVGTMSIGSDASLTVPKGTTLAMKQKMDITVNGGALIMQGEPDALARIKGFSGGWGSIVVQNGRLDAEHVEIVNGGYSNRTEAAMIIAKNNSIVHVENGSMLDPNKIGSVFYGNGSALSIGNSIVGWTTPVDSSKRNWQLRGINAFGGSIYLNNTIFQHMKRGIEGPNNAVGTKENMTNDHFIGITEMKWWPSTLFQ